MSKREQEALSYCMGYMAYIYITTYRTQTMLCSARTMFGRVSSLKGACIMDDVKSSRVDAIDADAPDR